MYSGSGSTRFNDLLKRILSYWRRRNTRASKLVFGLEKLAYEEGLDEPL